MKTKDACKFTKQHVDPNWIQTKKRVYDEEAHQYKYVEPDWLEIPTPAFHQILSYQKLGYKEDKTDEENEMAESMVHRWIYALLGRLLYDLGDKDEWQIIPYFRGLAGTGKSSIGRAVKNFFLPEDVAQLSNNIEKKFGLQGIYDKLMWVCFEAKEDFGLTQTDFQSIVSGEPMSIPVKFKEPVCTTWTAPGIMCGNVLPGWVNAQGSISRRVVLIDFIEGITGGDPTLPKQLAEQTAALMIKCNLAYHWSTNNYGHRLVWASLPSYFQEKQAQMEMETDSLYYFVMANEVLERSPWHDSSRSKNLPLPPSEEVNDDYRISMQNFEAEYNKWCSNNRRKLVNLADKNNLRHTLKRAELATRKEPFIIAGVQLEEQWIIGIRKRPVTSYSLENMHASSTLAVQNFSRDNHHGDDAGRAPPPPQN